MIDKKDSFIVRKKYWNQIQKLTANQRVELIECVFSYQLEWKYESEDWAVCMLLDIMIDEWEKDNEKYLEMCEKNREIALERERKKKLKKEKSHEQHEREQACTNVTNNTDNDSDMYRLLSKDNNVDESTEQKDVNEMLYAAYPFKWKWVDKEICDKLIDKQFKQWSTLNWMLKEMKLELLEMRVKQWKSHQYWKKLENRLREYVEWMADSEDRLRELLAIHRKRLESWPPYRKNPRDEMCELFWEDCVKRLFMETKQWVKLFTT